MSNRTPEVNRFMQELHHPLRMEIGKIRSIVLDTVPEITEHVKWGAPSFCYKGEDRITFKLQPEESVSLIFHRGAKVRDTTDFVFNDSTGLLKWAAKDRAILTFVNMEDVEAKREGLALLVKSWMESTPQ